MAAKNNISLFMVFPYGNLRWGMPTELKGGRVYSFIGINSMTKNDESVAELLEVTTFSSLYTNRWMTSNPIQFAR